MPSKVEWYGQKVEEQTLQNAKKGVNAVTQKIADAANANLIGGLPRRKRRKAIRSQKAKRKGKAVSGKVGTSKKDWPVVFLEYGAGPHEIKPKRARILAWPMVIGSQLGTRKSLYLSMKGRVTKQKARAARVYARSVQHPGINPTHFISRAVDTVWPAAPAIMAEAANSKQE